MATESKTETTTETTTDTPTSFVVGERAPAASAPDKQGKTPKVHPLDPTLDPTTDASLDQTEKLGEKSTWGTAVAGPILEDNIEEAPAPKESTEHTHGKEHSG